MPQAPKSTYSAEPSFWLNPNVVSRIQSGFKTALQGPILIREPEPDFAVTVPGDPGLLESAPPPHDQR